MKAKLFVSLFAVMSVVSTASANYETGKPTPALLNVISTNKAADKCPAISMVQIQESALVINPQLSSNLESRTYKFSGQSLQSQSDVGQTLEDAFHNDANADKSISLEYANDGGYPAKFFDNYESLTIWRDSFGTGPNPHCNYRLSKSQN